MHKHKNTLNDKNCIDSKRESVSTQYSTHSHLSIIYIPSIPLQTKDAKERNLQNYSLSYYSPKAKNAYIMQVQTKTNTANISLA